MSSGEFEYAYDLTPSASSFAFASVSNGSFSGAGVFSGTPLELPETFVFAARGSAGNILQIEITDTSHRVVRSMLRLDPFYQNYNISLPSLIPDGFDRTHIAQITFVSDRQLSGTLTKDLIQIKLNGMAFQSTTLPAPLLAVRNELIQKGASFFQPGVGVDPVTHFPYDNVEADGHVHPAASFTQPVAIGFYLQILGDIVNGRIQSGMSADQALNEIQIVVNNLLSVQSDTRVSWKGLIPWLNLPDLSYGPMGNTIGLGDNASLAQSLAVMMGALERAALSPAQRQAAEGVMQKAEQFLNAQSAGYLAMFDSGTGLLHASVQVHSESVVTYSGHMDRLASEFRGALAFLKVRYAALPESIWTGLQPIYRSYTARSNLKVQNLAGYDGSAFQLFWPSLRNHERDFMGFRNSLYNALVTYADFSASMHLPGIPSASQRPNNVDVGGEYYGRIGMPQIAESGNDLQDGFLMDLGSTYALASAFGVDSKTVMTWLSTIQQSVPSLNGTYGFFDAARSSGEVTQRFLAIDVAASVLGLTNTGADDFEIYLRNRGLEAAYNRLYDQASKKLAAVISKVGEAPSLPGSLPDRNYAVFNHYESEGSVNHFPVQPTAFTGVSFKYGQLSDGFGGQYWVLNQNYDARANQLAFLYSGTDSPKSIKIELKDEFDQLIYQTVISMPQASSIARAAVTLPQLAGLASVRKIFVIVDQNATNDLSGDFRIHAIDFLHLK